MPGQHGLWSWHPAPSMAQPPQKSSSQFHWGQQGRLASHGRPWQVRHVSVSASQYVEQQPGSDAPGLHEASSSLQQSSPNSPLAKVLSQLSLPQHRLLVLEQTRPFRSQRLLAPAPSVWLKARSAARMLPAASPNLRRVQASKCLAFMATDLPVHSRYGGGGRLPIRRSPSSVVADTECSLHRLRTRMGFGKTL